MDVYKIYDLTVVNLFKCVFNLGPRTVNMLQVPRCLNPAVAALVTTTSQWQHRE